MNYQTGGEHTGGKGNFPDTGAGLKSKIKQEVTRETRQKQNKKLFH